MKGKMQALMKAEAAPGAQLTEVDIPEIGPKDMLVRVRAAAICGTDIHIYNWNKYAQDRIKVPMIFGHEFCGEVVAVGDQVEHLQVGDLVAGETHIPCGECLLCRTGRQHICRDMLILGVHTPGVFSEYAAMPAVLGWKIPKETSPDVGAVLEPIGVACHSIFTGGGTAAANTLVVGSGPIGLAATGIAKALGARQVISTDVSPERLALAKEWGADVTLNPKEVDVAEEVRKLTDGLGADVVIEASGAPVAIQQAFDAMRRGGKIMLFGLPGESVELDLTNNVIYKEAVVYGTTGRGMWDTWYHVMALVESGRIDPEKLITDRFPMSQFEEAFAAAAAGKGGKVILYPGQ
ncbi:MAG: L-threonine 3-dehydrogenase [Limnochordia bacterium]|jgi:threonine 3-dehydrogenase